MTYELSAEEARVLGALLEKEHTTPDYYPLSLNALVNACNQKSNREPVMNLTDNDVLACIDGLRKHEFAWLVQSVDARVPKYEENVARKLDLTLQEVAALCILLLRGPQTIGEIRGRTGRIYPYESMDEVTMSVEALMQRETPLVVKLPLQPGRKEARYTHLLCGELDLEALAEAAAVPTPAPRAAVDDGRVEALEARVQTLEAELHELKQTFAQFKAEFE